MSQLTLPVSTTALAEYLPHRSPMRWVDEVVSVDATSGVCAVRFDSKAHYCDENGELRATAFVEWMAQSYGYVKATQVALGLVNIAQVPKVTFLAQIRNAKLPTKIGQHTSFQVKVMCTRILGPLSLVSGTVSDANGTVLASAELKLYAE
jgi:predicted hotdog family 3-hydroxylacyl-ACP dehydratase